MESDSSDDDANDGQASSSRSSDKPSTGFTCPHFDVTAWNPMGAAGIQFMTLVPFGAEHQQQNHCSKVKVSVTHRKQRHKNFQVKVTTCRNILDERRLRTACNEDDYITVVELLEGGVDPSSADEKSRTPLHIAASQGHGKIVSALLDKGADPNKKDFIGNIPLHLAACSCHVPVVTQLLKAGTDLQSVDRYGRTPLQLAKSRLNMLSTERAHTCPQQLQNDLCQISEMMTTYLRLSGHHDNAKQVDALCEKLQATSTRETLDEVNLMLSDFASMSIQNKTS